MFSARAAKIAARRRGFMLGSGTPSFAATVISRASFENSLERAASCRPLRCMMFLNWECPAMASFRDRVDPVEVTEPRGLRHPFILGPMPRQLWRTGRIGGLRVEGHDGAGLLAVIPDIGRKLPVGSDFFPEHQIFAGDFLRRGPLGLQAEDTDLARRGRSQRLHVERR